MKLKLDAMGNVVTKDVNGEKHPIYVHDDGSEAPFDAKATVASITSRAEQSARVEGENKTLKQQLAAFAEIKDPAAALAALQTVQNLKDGDLVKAGDVERIRREAGAAWETKLAEAQRAFEAQLTDIKGENAKLKDTLYGEMIGGQFSRSKFIADQCAVPSDLVQARFGNNFGIDNGKVYAVDSQGNKIFSKARPGELADFDEALSVLISQYPYKDQILKGTGASGGGAGGGRPAQGFGGKKQISRAEFEAISDPAQKAEIAKGKDFVIV